MSHIRKRGLTFLYIWQFKKITNLFEDNGEFFEFLSNQSSTYFATLPILKILQLDISFL